MTLDPENGSQEEEELAISSIVSRARTSLYEDKIAQKARTMRRSDGSTNSIPQAAPLVFPGLDELAGKTDEKSKKKKGSLGSASDFVGRYLDKRAVAKYVRELHKVYASDLLILQQGAKHPESKLTQPKPVFKSRYADPTHPAASGNFRALLTGGKSAAQTSSQATKEGEKGQMKNNRVGNDDIVEKKDSGTLMPHLLSSDEHGNMPASAEQKSGSKVISGSSGESQLVPDAKGGFLTPVKKAIKSVSSSSRSQNRY